ncbi:MAG TPA: flagellar export protein FliJ [Phycisphaerales bacterium]|nr:flagellar export protein FliJ [Phycisphaerales bacterium]
MARGFRFQLQPVLEQRERQEREQQRRVALIEGERVALENRLREIQGQIEAAKGELRGRLGRDGTTVVVRDVRFQAGATLALLVQAQSTALALAGTLKRLEAARGELLKATTARKAVQLLKDRRYAQWRLERERKEAAEVDEIATGAHVRRMIAERVAGAGAAGEAS